MVDDVEMAVLETRTVEDVEIARVGVWQSSNAGAVPITQRDLDDMVVAYKATATDYPVPLKIGHEMRQQVFGDLAGELGDGEPAFGWVGALRRDGERLLADFTDVPAKLAELLRAKTWRNRSPEIRFNAKVGSRSYPRMLQAVALLGAVPPAIKGMADMFGEGMEMTTTLRRCRPPGTELAGRVPEGMGVRLRRRRRRLSMVYHVVAKCAASFLFRFCDTTPTASGRCCGNASQTLRRQLRRQRSADDPPSRRHMTPSLPDGH